MVRLYAGEGLSRKRLAMLEADARKMVQKGRLADALRILHCALLLNPESRQTLQFADEVMAKKLKIKWSQAKGRSERESAELDLLLKSANFSLYVMRAVDRGGFSRVMLHESW